MDGNKRVAHAAMETFLILNGKEIQSAVAEQGQLMLAVAAGAVQRVIAGISDSEYATTVSVLRRFVDNLEREDAA